MELGQLLAAAGKPDEAIAAYREAARLEPAPPPSVRPREDPRRVGGIPTGRSRPSARPSGSNPGNAEAHDFLGMYLVNARADLDAAITEFRAGDPVQAR